MHVAIIGAGMAGLACARELRTKGHEVTLYEQHHEVGGRVITHDTKQGSFDYGAQFFTASSEIFKKEVAYWRSAGMVMPWHGKLAHIAAGAVKPAQASSQRFVAVPGMGALTQFLALGLQVHTGYRVMRMEPLGAPGQKQWALRMALEGTNARIDEGPFDAVVVATPADVATTLLKPVPLLATRAASVGHMPCWTLMLVFKESLGLAYDGAWVEHPKLGWMVRDASKPDRQEGERWMVLGRVEWSAEHTKLTPARARDHLLKAFQEATGKTDKPVHVAARLWPYAQSLRPVSKSCLWDERHRVGACGDWFTTGAEGSGQIEHAYLSGCLLANRMHG